MSRAESHDVGGDGSDAGSGSGDGEESIESHENGAGVGELVFFNLSDIDSSD